MVLVLSTWDDNVRLHSANKSAAMLIGQVRYLCRALWQQVSAALARVA